MPSEQVKQILDAEERARQDELAAQNKAATLVSQAKREATEILAFEIASAEKQAGDLLNQANKQAGEILERSVSESSKECRQLRADSATRWEKAVSSVISVIIE